jgi:hypothetical protein
LDEFISYAGSRGISGRWSSKKEAGRFQGPIQPFKVNNRALVFERDGKQEYFSDGMLVRIFFHGMPVAGGVDMIEAFLREEDNAAE